MPLNLYVCLCVEAWAVLCPDAKILVYFLIWEWAGHSDKTSNKAPWFAEFLFGGSANIFLYKMAFVWCCWPLATNLAPKMASHLLQPTILTPDLNPIRNWRRAGKGDFPKCMLSRWVVSSPSLPVVESFWASTIVFPNPGSCIYLMSFFFNSNWSLAGRQHLEFT